MIVLDPTNKVASLRVDEDGALVISGAVGGGGGGGDASAANQVTGNASLASIDSKTPALSGGKQPVIGPLTDTELRASAVPVSLSGTTPVSMASAPAGAALESTASSNLPYLPSIYAKLPSLGAAAANGSSPVTLATDQLGFFDNMSSGGFGPLTALNTNIIDQTSGVSTGTNMLAVAARSLTIQITPAAGTVTAGAITFEGSNDNTNYVPIPLYDIASLTANPVTTYTVVAATPRFFVGNLLFKYFRARISTGLTGTSTGVSALVLYSPEPFVNPQQTVTQATAANLNTTVTGTVGISGTVTTALATPATAYLNSAASTNATSAKASAGNVYSVTCSNSNAAVRYLKLYNKASAPTVGTDIPVIVLPIPPGTAAQIDSGSGGFRFSSGIAFALTTGATDADTGAVAAGEHKVAIAYI